MESIRNFFNKLRAVLFCDQNEEGRLCRALHWLINLAFLALWCYAIGLVGLYFAKTGFGIELFQSYFESPLLPVLNILPGFLIAALFLFITGRVWPAVLTSGLVILGISIANMYKMMFRDDPLLASDLSKIVEAAQISGNYTFTFPPALILSAAAFVAALVFSVFLMRARIRKPLVRILGTVLTLGVCIALYMGPYSSEDIYNETANFDVQFASSRALNQWSDSDRYRCRGCIYPFINSASKISNQKPDDYDRAEAEALLAQYSDDAIPEDKRVNVIAVMLEAYVDFSVYENMAPAMYDAYEFWHELEEESVSGSLLTNIFAGGTIDTERCFLTGTKMYEYRSAADSFVRYFSENGYRTEFCHPGYDWFYNRRNVSEYLGFDASYFHSDRYDPGDGSILDDKDFFPDLISLFEESKAAGEPYFNFSVTYQNHGPYYDYFFNDPSKVFVNQGELSLEAYRILTNYLEGISRTDAALRDFVEYFRSEEEPVVLVFFGDHKPWLGDNSYVYAELGLDLSLKSEESFRAYFETPYIIWANDAAKEALGRDFTGEGGDFSPMFLMQELFAQCGWEGDSYSKYLGSLRERLSVINTSGFYVADGSLVAWINDEYQAMADTAERLAYYRMRDAMR